MRLIVTSDLHYDHAKSTTLAERAIDEINRMGGDVLLVIGDTATPHGESLEKCLSLFRFSGPKLFVAGNHELWLHNGGDSYATYMSDLPGRVRQLGWHWLEDEPFRSGDIAIVGSIGWYDYSFAQPSLQIPLRFYREKVSPGAAAHLPEFAHLLEPADDIAPHAMETVARWNDGRFVKLGRTDEQFLHELIEKLEHHLASCITATAVVAAVHHLPFRELLPPPHSAQWDFTKAYLGSEALGRALQRYFNVRHVFCGHSHFPAEATIGHIHAMNPGSGYRVKRFATLDL